MSNLYSFIHGHFVLQTWCLGRPTMEGKTALGASSPAKPALHMPEPLSITRAATSSSHILDDYWVSTSARMRISSSSIAYWDKFRTNFSRIIRSQQNDVSRKDTRPQAGPELASALEGRGHRIHAAWPGPVSSADPSPQVFWHLTHFITSIYGNCGA